MLLGFLANEMLPYIFSLSRTSVPYPCVFSRKFYTDLSVENLEQFALILIFLSDAT